MDPIISLERATMAHAYAQCHTYMARKALDVALAEYKSAVDREAMASRDVEAARDASRKMANGTSRDSPSYWLADEFTLDDVPHVDFERDPTVKRTLDVDEAGYPLNYGIFR